MRWTLLLFLTACQGAGSVDPAALATDQAPVPADFRLAVTTTAAGTSGVATVTRAPAGARVDLVFSRAGFGTNCPPLLGGACLDLAAPLTFLASTTVAPDGSAALPFVAPLAAGDRRFGVQAVVRGAPSLVSNAVRVWIAPSTTPVGPASDNDLDGVTIGAGDCDDGDPAIFPGAPDLVGDGVDASCDGVDGLDADGDRSPAAASGGADCDDTDADVRPGATERCDQRDDDCDGQVDEDFADADGSGVLDCLEVATVITWGALRAEATGTWSCDGLPFVERERVAFADALASAGLGAVFVDEDELAGVSAAQLAGYGAIAVLNVGWPDGLRTQTVDALLAHSDVPLLFAGDDTGLMVDRTETIIGRPELHALTGILTTPDNGAGVFKGLGYNLVDPDHPIIQGPFGPTGSSGYAGDMDHVELIGGEQVFFTKDSVGTPVGWAFEVPRRTAVLLPGLFSTNTCPLYTGGDVAQAEQLYQNTVAWLLNLP
jgi:hypothetical protein